MDINDLKDELLNPNDQSSQFDPSDIEQNKILAAVAGVPILFWVPLVACGGSAFGKFYANQGLILTILSIAVAVVCAVLGIIPVIGGFLAGILGTVCGLVILAGMLLLVISAATGKAKELPIVGSMLKIF